MNPLIPLRKAAPLLLIVVALVSVARAVSPPPDGGYPGGNTAEGQSALLSLTTGGFNTAVGWLSLSSDTEGSYNTAIGAGALISNTTGISNSAVGVGALLYNTTGGGNTATGVFALASNSSGYSNTASGVSALASNTIGNSNTANGQYALVNNTSGIENTATGFRALSSNVQGYGNTADGYEALSNNVGGFNTAIGHGALFFNIGGSENVAVGEFALGNNTGGIHSVALGVRAGGAVLTANNVICIGAAVNGTNVSDTCFIGNIFGVTTGMDAAPVVIDANGQLGTVASSRRLKGDVKPMDKASEAILALKPVTFHYKNSKKDTPQFGLIAQDVAKANPDLVVRDKNGEIYTVRYDAVNAMLLNEFLKEHRKVEEQQAIIAKLKSTVAQQQKSFQSRLAEEEKQIAALASGLQKVSAQIEMDKFATGRIRRGGPAPRVVLNNP